MKVVLSSDHRGYAAKENIKSYLEKAGHTVTDAGCHDATSCDYPDMGLAGAREVAQGEAERGIFLCGTGIGMSIAANKVKGIRAALCHDELTAELSRRHNDANVLCLPADLIGEHLINRVIDVWLQTEYEGGRHQRRIDKITTYERNGHVASPDTPG